MFFGNQVRQDGTAHGKVETAENSVQYQDNVDGMHGMRGTPTDREQQGGAKAEAGVANHQQLAAVEQIGGVSGEKKKHDAGQKLCQADVSQIDRAFGDLVDLPSHGDGLHFERHDDEEARERI